jgi:hypothetical protein
MTTEYSGPALVQDDDELTRQLRAIYAAPADAEYWHALEARILDRIAAGDGVLDAWWSVPTGWTRIGLVAAAAAVLISGALALRTQVQMAKAEYEQVIEPAVGDAPVLAERERLTEQQRAIRLLTGH